MTAIEIITTMMTMIIMKARDGSAHLALGRQKQDDHKFESSLGFIARHCFNKSNNKNR
jgi:hypothetical protein